MPARPPVMPARSSVMPARPPCHSRSFKRESRVVFQCRATGEKSDRSVVGNHRPHSFTGMSRASMAIVLDSRFRGNDRGGRE